MNVVMMITYKHTAYYFFPFLASLSSNTIKKE